MLATDPDNIFVIQHTCRKYIPEFVPVLLYLPVPLYLIKPQVQGQVQIGKKFAFFGKSSTKFSTLDKIWSFFKSLS